MRSKAIKILILEDEIPAYQKLIGCLQVFFTEGITHDWARSISEGKKFLIDKTYDFLLSDIQLLDGTSFDLFNSVSIESPIIFCSAHDDYLFQAFNTNGIAYILKPYTQADFNKAIEKYQALFKQGDYNALNNSTIADNEGKRYPISQNLSSIYSQLNPKKHFKINRSEVVHIDCIENIESYFKNRLLITMKGYKEKVMTSSSSTAEFRRWLEQ